MIEQAKGLVMGLYGIGPDAAFALLRRWSQASHTKLREIAAALTLAAQHSAGPGGPSGVRRVVAQLERSPSAGRPAPPHGGT